MSPPSLDYSGDSSWTVLTLMSATAKYPDMCKSSHHVATGQKHLLITVGLLWMRNKGRSWRVTWSFVSAWSHTLSQRWTLSLLLVTCLSSSRFTYKINQTWHKHHSCNLRILWRRYMNWWSPSSKYNTAEFWHSSLTFLHCKQKLVLRPCNTESNNSLWLCNI